MESVMAWKKMMTAPKTGERFLGKNPNGYVGIYHWEKCNRFGLSGWAWGAHNICNALAGFTERLVGWQPLPRR
jgi:hypothetical protein